jgi:hypothetical protein
MLTKLSSNCVWLWAAIEPTNGAIKYLDFH